MPLDNPIKLYGNPCKTIGSGKCREYGIDLGGLTLRRCRRTAHELGPQYSLLLEYEEEAYFQTPWTTTLRKMLSGEECGN